MFQRWIEIPFRRSCLIIGSRRSGKTTLLKHRYPDWPYATLDDLDYLDRAKKDPKGLISHLGNKAIIDEIQRLPMLTVAVKFAVDNEKARFLMTGSSTLGLLDAAADSLAGRIDIISLPTACWGEELGGPTHFLLNDQEIEAKRIDITLVEHDQAEINSGDSKIVVSPSKKGLFFIRIYIPSKDLIKEIAQVQRQAYCYSL